MNQKRFAQAVKDRAALDNQITEYDVRIKVLQKIATETVRARRAALRMRAAVQREIDTEAGRLP